MAQGTKAKKNKYNSDKDGYWQHYLQNKKVGNNPGESLKKG